MYCAHVWISGIVQGVWFRDHTEKMAKHAGSTGWVRNLSDGRVEAVFEGPKEIVEEMIEWCKKGSPNAKVDNVAVIWEKPENLSKFKVLY